MKYLVLLIGDGELKPWPDHTREEQAAVMRQFEAFDAACARARRRRDPRRRGARPARPTPPTLRTRGGATTLTEGPYAEVIEQMGGFYLVEAPDLDVLVELLGLLPAVRHAGLPCRGPL